MTETNRLLMQILREIEGTNRLLTQLLAKQTPVYPTVEELGLVPHAE